LSALSRKSTFSISAALPGVARSVDLYSTSIAIVPRNRNFNTHRLAIARSFVKEFFLPYTYIIAIRLCFSKRKKDLIFI
jgi:hypothetical protein